MSVDAGRALRQAISEDLRVAQRSRDRERMRLLRVLIAAIDNGEAVAATQAVGYSNPGLGRTEADRRTLDVAAVRALMQAEIDERHVAAGHYRDNDQDDLARQFDADCQVITRYIDELPGHLERFAS